MFNILYLYKFFNKKIWKSIYINIYNIKKNNILLYVLYLYNNIFKLYNLSLSKNLNYFEIEKGLKKKVLKIYLRAFLNDNLIIENENKYCILIIRFVRKNLFFTLLNTEGNVLCKTNIGSCGFKKKVKFTGYAIKKTSKKFSRKILLLFIKKIYLINNNLKKEIKVNKENLTENLNLLKNKWKKIINNKKIWKKIKQRNLNYRNYSYYSKIIQQNLNIKLRIKSNLKFWGFRFIMHGLGKKFRWFNGIDIRVPTPHSLGLRLKKKRRV